MILVTRLIPYSAMAVYPFILIKKKELQHNEVLIFHEKIHHRQQLELLIIPFYLLYFLNYTANLIIYRNHYKAYRQIVFEREAYTMEKNFEYLKKRKFFSFVNYFN